jgi:hypothetical protein
MSSCLTLVVALLSAQDAPRRTPALADGVYVVLREGSQKKDLAPLANGEVVVVNRHRYLPEGDKEPPRFLVVRPVPDVPLDLAGAPKADRENGDVVRIRLQLRPAAAATLERLTRAQQGRQIAIILRGDVVTQHKIRSVISNGAVQITSCAPKAAAYLLRQLEARPGSK